jgi:hypothetical protein
MSIEKHLDWLGEVVRDRVTGMEGVVTSIAFDLYGCIQAVVEPQFRDGKKPEHGSVWCDVSRLILFGGERVMNAPNFGEPVEARIASGSKGPAEKPLPR